jgi:uncharacterized Zn-finger protein
MAKTTTQYLKNEAGEFVCPHCGETKARANTMFYHMKKHTGEKAYACEHEGCDKRFVQKSALQQHILQAHTREAPTFACPCCDHTARIKSNLAIHIGRKHGTGWIPAAAGSGECDCANCKKSFSSATAYYYHAVKCFEPPADIAEGINAILTA